MDEERQARLIAAAASMMAAGRENITFSLEEIADFIAALDDEEWERLQRLADHLDTTRDRIH